MILDLPPGEKIQLQDLKNLVTSDEKLQNLTKEQEQMLMDKLVQHRDGKTTSVRSSNAAAARDILCTSDNIIKEVRLYL